MHWFLFKYFMLSSGTSSWVSSPVRSPCRSNSFQYEFKWFKDDFDMKPRARGRCFTHRSALELERSEWSPPLPGIFSNFSEIQLRFSSDASVRVAPEVAEQWPQFAGRDEVVRLEAAGGGKISKNSKKVFPDSPPACGVPPPRFGIVVTGEWVPASGTHNVVVGIVRGLWAQFDGNVEVLGFLGGPQGFARGYYIKLTPESVAQYLNQGGADLLGFGSLRAMDARDFLEIRQLVVSEYRLEGLVFIGGPNELSHVAQLLMLGLAEEGLGAEEWQLDVIEDNVGRKSIDRFAGDIRLFPTTIVSVFQSPNSNVYIADWLPVTLGFDSTRAALVELVGNIAMDGLSGTLVEDVVNFIRAGSTTLTLAIAAEVRPAYVVVAEEVREKNLSIQVVVEALCDVIRARRQAGIRWTTVLVTDKFYENLSELLELQREARAVYADAAAPSVSSTSQAVLGRFTCADQSRLMRAYDLDGTPTWPEECPEQLLSRLVSEILKIPVRSHFIGSEGRCPLPTDFDCSLGLALGLTAAALVSDRRCNGYVALVGGIDDPPQLEKINNKWVPGGVPLPVLLAAPAAPAAWLFDTNQELINLAQQRIEREWGVPRIALKKHHVLSSGSFCDPLVAFPRQPGPYQWERKLSRRDLYVPGWPLLGRPSNWTVTPRRMGTSSSALAVLFPCTYAVSAVEFGDAKIDSRKIFCVPATVGVVFAGMHAPGVHNAVWGLVEGLGGADTRILGFRNGFEGLENDAEFVEITQHVVQRYKNQSGNDLLGGGVVVTGDEGNVREWIETLVRLEVSALIVVGDASCLAISARLADKLVSENISLLVVPASVQNNIPFVDLSVGHSTACAVHASVVGNLSTLAASTNRTWCFVQLLGCTSSVVLEVGRRTNANLILITEEVDALDLGDLIDMIADLVAARASQGTDFGLILFADDLLNHVSKDELSEYMTVDGKSGVPQILEWLVRDELSRRKLLGESVVSAFVSSKHSLCHIARSSLPSDLDCDLGFGMGVAAAALLHAGKTGLLVTATTGQENFRYGGFPLAGLWEGTGVAVRKNKNPVFPNSPPVRRRFVNPGALQFGGPREMVAAQPSTTQLFVDRVETLAKSCSRLMGLAGTVGDKPLVDSVLAGLEYVESMLLVEQGK